MGAYKDGPRKCEIPGCDRKHSGHGMCRKHYSRWYRHRDLSRDRQAYWTELFWSHVDKSGDCWLWTGHLINGYGRTRVSGRVKGAHALSYELTVGPVPEGLVLDHICHNNDLSCAGGSDCLHRRCVNPAHLEPVTPRVNTLRGRAATAENAVKDRCVNGHPFDEANTYYGTRPNGDFRRACRACGREWKRRKSERARIAA